MGLESIKVVFEPIVPALSGTIAELYHGTLVYTNAAGQQFYAAGTRSVQNMDSIGGVGNPKNIFAAESGSSMPYGKLITLIGTVGDANQKAYGNQWLLPSNSESNLLSGADLSSQWSKMTNAMSQINSKNLIYQPVSQNSNSAWCTAALAGGASSSVISNAIGTYTVPGCVNVINTTFGNTDAFYRAMSTAMGTDANGYQTVTLTETSPSGMKLLDLVGHSSTSDYQQFLMTPLTGKATVDVSGNGAVVTQNGININLASGAFASLIGGGNLVTETATSTINISNIGSIFNFNTVNATGGTINLGQFGQANINGNGTTSNLLSGGVSLGLTSGGNNTVNGIASGDRIWVQSTGAVGVNGFNTLNGSNARDNVNAADGQKAGIYFQGGAQANLNGSNNTSTLYAGGVSLGLTSGGSNTVNGITTGDRIFVQNTGAVGANGFNVLNGSNAQDNANSADGQKAGIYLAGGAQANVYGSNNVETLFAGGVSLGLITGGSNTVNGITTGDRIWVQGTGAVQANGFNTLNGNNAGSNTKSADGQQAGIYLYSGAQANLNGNNNGLNLLSDGVSLGITSGGSNTVNGITATDRIWIQNTGSAGLNILNANNVTDTANSTDGQKSGIYLMQGAQASCIGNNNILNMQSNSNAYVGLSGTNTTVKGNSGSDLVNLIGAGSTATIFGGGTIGLCGNNQTAVLGDAHSTVNTIPYVISDSIYDTGGYGTINLNTLFLGSIVTNHSVVNMNEGASINITELNSGTVVNTSKSDAIRGSNLTINTGTVPVQSNEKFGGDFIAGDHNNITVVNSGYPITVMGNDNNINLNNKPFINDGNEYVTAIGDRNTFSNVPNGLAIHMYSSSGALTIHTWNNGVETITTPTPASAPPPPSAPSSTNNSRTTIYVNSNGNYVSNTGTPIPNGTYIPSSTYYPPAITTTITPSGTGSGYTNTTTVIDYQNVGGVSQPQPVLIQTITTCANGVDPIILNLQGKPITTQSLNDSSTYFDMQNNGQAVQTGWATAGEGMLVYNPTNPDGAVTQDSQLVAGFSVLQGMDSNHDGVFNNQDQAWKDMRVWVTDSIGSFNAGQLHSLDQLGITSINLNSSHVNQDSNGNTLLDDSTFTWANGNTGDIAGVDLAFNPNAIQTAVAEKPMPSSLDSLISAMASFAPASASSSSLVNAANSSFFTPLLTAAH